MTPKLEYIRAESQKLFDADVKAAQAAYEQTIFEPDPDDGFPTQQLSPYDPIRRTAQRAYDRALNAAEGRHRARVAVSEIALMGSPQAIWFGGREVTPNLSCPATIDQYQRHIPYGLFTPSDVDAARTWFAKIKIPEISPTTHAPDRETVQKAREDVLTLMAHAFIANPGHVRALLNGTN